MIKGLWNIGLKTADIDEDIEFFMSLGAEMLLRDRVTVGGVNVEYAALQLGGVKILLFPKVVFEDKIEGGVRPGLTHVVYEVDNFDVEYERIKGSGATVLIEPVEISAGVGSRKLAFFRSPGGLVFEIMQIIEAKI